jgi:hypothetical protein
MPIILYLRAIYPGIKDQRPHITQYYNLVSRLRNALMRNFSKFYQTNPSSSKSLHQCAFAIPVVSVARRNEREKEKSLSRTKPNPNIKKERARQNLDQASSSALKAGMAHRCLSSNILRLNNPKSFINSSTSSWNPP